MVTAIPGPTPAATSAAPWYARRNAIVFTVTLGTALLATLFFTPRYWLWCFAGAPLEDVISIQPEFGRALFALQQLHDPWQRIDNPIHRVIEWRLFFPVVAHYLGFSQGLYFALPHLGCLAALGAAVFFAWRVMREIWAVGAVTLLAATASWYFVATGWLAYFDSWLVLGLLLASFARSRRVLFTVALIAPWVDERFVLALPLCLAVRCIADPAPVSGGFWRDARALLAGAAVYCVVRLGAELFHVRATSGSYLDSHIPLAAPLSGIALGLWHGLRLGWIAVCFGVTALMRERRWLALAGVLVGLIANLAAADDLSRSASVAVPLLVGGAIAYFRANATRARRVLGLLAVGNLLLPAAHIIATPRSPVETYHRAPILYLYAEREQAKNPPEFASPAAYTSRGMEALQAGRLDKAEGQFDLALRYDPDFPRARAHRGILLYVRGQKAAGMVEIDRALRTAPELYDVRLQRASFRQEMGDAAGALADVREALNVMPKDWPRRAQAEEFERQLAGRAR